MPDAQIHFVKHRHRPLCEDCAIAPAELNFRGTAWKKRCAECEHAFKFQCARKQAARQKLRLSSNLVEA
jgi:hypothetical protein